MVELKMEEATAWTYSSQWHPVHSTCSKDIAVDVKRQGSDFEDLRTNDSLLAEYFVPKLESILNGYDSFSAMLHNSEKPHCEDKQNRRRTLTLKSSQHRYDLYCFAVELEHFARKRNALMNTKHSASNSQLEQLKTAELVAQEWTELQSALSEVTLSYYLAMNQTERLKEIIMLSKKKQLRSKKSQNAETELKQTVSQLKQNLERKEKTIETLNDLLLRSQTECQIATMNLAQLRCVNNDNQRRLAEFQSHETEILDVLNERIDGLEKVSLKVKEIEQTTMTNSQSNLGDATEKEELLQEAVPCIAEEEKKALLQSDYESDDDYDSDATLIASPSSSNSDLTDFPDDGCGSFDEEAVNARFEILFSVAESNSAPNSANSPLSLVTSKDSSHILGNLETNGATNYDIDEPEMSVDLKWDNKATHEQSKCWEGDSETVIYPSDVYLDFNEPTKEDDTSNSREVCVLHMTATTEILKENQTEVKVVSSVNSINKYDLSSPTETECHVSALSDGPSHIKINEDLLSFTGTDSDHWTLSRELVHINTKSDLPSFRESNSDMDILSGESFDSKIRSSTEFDFDLEVLCRELSNFKMTGDLSERSPAKSSSNPPILDRGSSNIQISEGDTIEEQPEKGARLLFSSSKEDLQLSRGNETEMSVANNGVFEIQNFTGRNVAVCVAENGNGVNDSECLTEVSEKLAEDAKIPLHSSLATNDHRQGPNENKVRDSEVHLENSLSSKRSLIGSTKNQKLAQDSGTFLRNSLSSKESLPGSNKNKESIKDSQISSHNYWSREEFRKSNSDMDILSGDSFGSKMKVDLPPSKSLTEFEVSEVSCRELSNFEMTDDWSEQSSAKSYSDAPVLKRGSSNIQISEGDTTEQQNEKEARVLFTNSKQDLHLYRGHNSEMSVANSGVLHTRIDSGENVSVCVADNGKRTNDSECLTEVSEKLAKDARIMLHDSQAINEQLQRTNENEIMDRDSEIMLDHSLSSSSKQSLFGTNKGQKLAEDSGISLHNSISSTESLIGSMSGPYKGRKLVTGSGTFLRNLLSSEQFLSESNKIDPELPSDSGILLLGSSSSKEFSSGIDKNEKEIKKETQIFNICDEEGNQDNQELFKRVGSEISIVKRGLSHTKMESTETRANECIMREKFQFLGGKSNLARRSKIPRYKRSKVPFFKNLSFSGVLTERGTRNRLLQKTTVQRREFVVNREPGKSGGRQSRIPTRVPTKPPIKDATGTVSHTDVTVMETGPTNTAVVEVTTDGSCSSCPSDKHLRVTDSLSKHIKTLLTVKKEVAADIWNEIRAKTPAGCYRKVMCTSPGNPERAKIPSKDKDVASSPERTVKSKSVEGRDQPEPVKSQGGCVGEVGKLVPRRRGQVAQLQNAGYSIKKQNFNAEQMRFPCRDEIGKARSKQCPGEVTGKVIQRHPQSCVPQKITKRTELEVSKSGNTVLPLLNAALQ